MKKFLLVWNIKMSWRLCEILLALSLMAVANETLRNVKLGTELDETILYIIKEVRFVSDYKLDDGM
jgi:hypothetical protein